MGEGIRKAIKEMLDYEQNGPWAAILSGKHMFQMLIGLPAAAALFYFWPLLISRFEPEAGTFSLGILEPVVVSIMYVMVGHSFAHIGAKLSDEHYEKHVIPGCDTSFLFYCLFFSAYVLAVLTVGRGVY